MTIPLASFLDHITGNRKTKTERMCEISSSIIVLSFGTTNLLKV